jgi:simple sugar transport system permease protein
MSGIFASAAPLLLAALGGLISDLSGALGVFIEGFMTLGSFFSWIIAVRTGSVFLGTFAAAAGAAGAGWLLARFVHKTGANPFIAGLAANLAATGICDMLSVFWFNTKGVLRNPSLHIPGAVPMLESLFGKEIPGQSPFVYLSWLCALVTAFVIRHTQAGLSLRAAGRSAEAARDLGIDPQKYRERAWAAAAFLASLAGAALTFRVGAYTPGGVAGRGWIALAAVYLGFRTPWGTAAAVMVFAFAERAGIAAQALGHATLLLGVPSGLALVLYAVSQGLGKLRKPT